MTMMPSIKNPVDNFRLNANTMREGIPIEKGVVVDWDWVEKNEDLIEYYC
mgnify:CR=1 FL=1|nr:MAG TPA: hypothetical protein [Caudoviricetes sp.]